jgi:hypothetical protein
MCFSFIAIEYNKFVIQCFYIFNKLDIDVKNIVNDYVSTTTIDKKLKKKLNKLHHKYFTDSGYLHKSNRYHSRSSEVLLQYLTIIINVIFTYNDIYFQKMLELYERLYDSVLNDLETEDTYLSAGEEIKFNKNIVSFFTSINQKSLTVSSEIYRTRCGCYVFEIHAYQDDSDDDYEAERAIIDDIRREH